MTVDPISNMAQGNSRDSVEKGFYALLDFILADGELSAEERQRYVSLMNKIGQKRRSPRRGVPFEVVMSSTLEKLEQGQNLDKSAKKQLANFIGISAVKQELKQLRVIDGLQISDDTLAKMLAFFACVPSEGSLRLLLQFAAAITVRASTSKGIGRISGFRTVEQLRCLSNEELDTYIQRFNSLSADCDRIEASFDILLDLVAADGWLSTDEATQLQAFINQVVQDEAMQNELCALVNDVGRIDDVEAVRQTMKSTLQKVNFFDRANQDLQGLTWVAWL